MISIEPRTLQVLLVDDDPDEFLLTNSLMDEIQFDKPKLSWAADRVEMRTHLSNNEVDVVLMDYRLGDYTGIELIQELVAAGSEIPFVLLAGAGTRAVDLEAMESGAVDYLDKQGLTSTELDRTIRYSVERARAQARERESNRFYRSLVEQTPAAFFVSASNDYALKSYVSPQLASLLDKDSADDTSWLDHVDVADRMAISAQIEHCNRTGERSSFNYRLHKQDGSVVWVQEEAVLIRDDHGQPIHWQGVIYDITARKQAEDRLRTREQELETANTALSRSNRALQEFVYIASHDLKSPLVAIVGMATMLQQDLDDTLDDDSRIHLERIIVNSVKMRQLLEDILDVSRVSQVDPDVLAMTSVDLNILLDDVRNHLRQQLDERQATVSTEETLPTIMSNAMQLFRVLMNLIDNAVKYTPLTREPHIVIRATDLGDDWMIAVSDNGSGIPHQRREQVFSMFQRLPNGKSMNPDGTGMGLTIVARIVELNGGRCWISDSDDNGTTICISLPKQATRPESQQSALPVRG